MKQLNVLIAAAVSLYFSCSNSRNPSVTESSVETGAVKVLVNLSEVGRLAKLHKAHSIEMSKVIIRVAAAGWIDVHDTISLTGGSRERTIQTVYSGLGACIDGQFLDWTLSVTGLDRTDHVVYKNVDTTFHLVIEDTIDIRQSLDARYSMMVGNFLRIPDSVTRCVLLIDNVTVADTSFPKQSYLDDTVTLNFDYVSASPAGETHHIDLNVFGEIDGSEKLLYTGDTTIQVKSGESTVFQILLEYLYGGIHTGTSSMTITLNTIGILSVDGEIQKVRKFFLEMTSGGHGTVSGTDSLTLFMSRTITATPDSGYYFLVWRVIAGTAVIGDSTLKSTSVELSSGDARIEGVFSNTPITFQKVYPEYAAGISMKYSIEQTVDNGFLLAGNEILKTDAKGAVVWSNKIAVINCVNIQYVQSTTENGFVVTGYYHCPEPIGSGITWDNTQISLYMSKIDSVGGQIWGKKIFSLATYSTIAYGNAVQQTQDNGFVFTGRIDYNSGGFLGKTGSAAFILKVNSDGATAWAKIFDNCIGKSIVQSRDGTCVITGETTLNTTEKSNVFIVKINDNGDTVWTKATGGESYEGGNSIQQARDGGYIITGYTQTYGAGKYDVFLVKTDANGNVAWTRTYGGVEDDCGESVRQTDDNGYIIVGYTDSFGKGGRDVFVIKTDADGDTVWTKTFGGVDDDFGNSVLQTSDGGYVISGCSNSHCLLIKTDKNGNLQ